MIIENYKTENITERESGSEANALAVKHFLTFFQIPKKCLLPSSILSRRWLRSRFIVFRAFETYKLLLINDANGTNYSLF